MKVICCKCGKKYKLEDNIFEYEKDTTCPILICPHCGFKHAINFMPFENQIKNLKKVEKIDLVYYPLLGASRIADSDRVDQSLVDDGDVKAYQIATAVYNSHYGSISGGEPNPLGLKFKPDGKKVYLVGITDCVHQYSLSTAWDITTLSYDDKYKDFSDDDTVPRGIAFSLDGTSLYMMGSNHKTVFQYTLSTPWDVSTAGSPIGSKDISAQDIAPHNIVFNPTGTILYVVGNATDTIYQYTLSTPWDIDSLSYSKSLYVGGEENQPHSIDMSPDGKIMLLKGSQYDYIQEWLLSTAWDVSTAVYSENYFDTSSIDTSTYGCEFSGEGTKVYFMGHLYDRIYELDLTGNWDKANDFILATGIYGSKGPYDRAYKLRWRKVGGTFVDVGATGAITYSADTVLVDGTSLLIESKICAAQNGYAWQNGMESEGDNLLPDSGTYSLTDEYYTEFQWALSCDDAEDEAEYEFELWDNTEGVSLGTCGATITMGITPSGFKWNTKIISKWNTKEFTKWNGLE